MGSENWSSLFDSTDPDDAINIFNTKMENAIKKSMTSIEFKTSNRNRKIKEWITKGFITSIRNRDKMSKKLRLCPFDTQLKDKLYLYKTILYTLIKKAKSLYYQKSLKKLKHNPKELWKMINDISGRGLHKNKCNDIDKILLKDGKLIDYSTCICNHFNTFLLMLVITLRIIF